ncbi:MAG: 2-oxoglutarate dehydrogenase, E2 component, dihydrolipoamide succinyltransferase [Acidobacteria bacterium]|nr:2-oxoglutarate dehydrogenase, E2 component, dihydrolipoamide succinyltransferase [Acidobacteriota bacterium]
MATDVLMPQMGESIAEGTIVKWLKKVGDTVGRDEPLLEISTDKVDAEVPSPAAGVLLEILANEGETVLVNAIIGRLGEAGEAGAPAAAAPAPVVEASQPAAAPEPVAAPPVAPAASVSASNEESSGGKVRSSPLVRNIAREHGVNLEQVAGTGLGGRVTKEDILGFIERGKGIAAPVAAPAISAAPVAAPIAAPVPVAAPAPIAAPLAPPAPVFAAGDRITIEPMTNMRRRIAENMLASRRTSAHVTTFFEVDFTNIARLRERTKKSFEAQNGTKLTFLPFVIKATIDALKALPIVNSSVEGDNIVYKHDYNVGIAVALDWGLIVPVIKQADALSITGLARASQDLANRARAKQLKPDEISGGTFSITNFGLYGGYTATPIINQPQVAILGMGGIHKKPWVIETPDGDAIAIRHIGVMSLSFDHRIIDGAVGDQFLAHIKKTIETTDFSALL